MRDIKELNDEELEKVSGGYVEGVHKEIGYAFYASPLKNMVSKISGIDCFAGNINGYRYTIDVYFDGVYASYGGTEDDRQIDDYVSRYGRP